MVNHETYFDLSAMLLLCQHVCCRVHQLYGEGFHTISRIKLQSDGLASRYLELRLKRSYSTHSTSHEGKLK